MGWLSDIFGKETENPGSGNQKGPNQSKKEVLSVDLPQEWNFENMHEHEEYARKITADMEDYYSRAGYRLPEGGVKVHHTSEGSSRYHGREGSPNNGNQIQLSINPGGNGGWIPSYLHEMGHDILRYTVGPQLQNKSVLTYRTMDELFSDMNMRFFDETPGDSDYYGRNPYSEEFDWTFNILKPAFDPDYREREEEDARNLIENFDNLSEEEISSEAEDLYYIPPTPSSVINLSSSRAQENIFLDNIEIDYFGEWNPVHTIAAAKLHIRDLGAKIEREGLEGCRSEVVEDFRNRLEDLEEFSSKYKTFLEENIPDESDYPEARLLLSMTSDVVYGLEWDETVDFPHSVGGGLAKVFHRNGYSPLDVLENPETFVSDVQGELLEVTQNRIEKPYGSQYNGTKYEPDFEDTSVYAHT